MPVCVGREEGQLWYPRKVAVIRTSGKYVVCDRGSERSRMQIFTKNGQFIKKIAIRYIDIVAGLAITTQGVSLVLVLAHAVSLIQHTLAVLPLVLKLLKILYFLSLNVLKKANIPWKYWNCIKVGKT